MVQRENGIIRKLRKGCCWTERTVMFLISVLVLLMGIKTVLACECEEIDWRQLMCPYEDKTVVMAGFLNETKIGSSTSFYMVIEKIFKARRHNFTDIDIMRFTMVTPVACSPVYNRSEFALYIIYGDTDADGVLHTNKCNMELYDDEFFNHYDRDGLMQIMWGKVTRTCRGDS